MISLYRLSSARFPSNSGYGAAKFGGRWNPVGTPVIYAAETASPAALEVLVHYSVLPKDFVLTEIQIRKKPGNRTIGDERVARRMDGEVVVPETQQPGRLWVTEGRSAVLSVPSSILPKERNFVINPDHPAFRKIRFVPSEPFAFDPRLKR